MPAARLSVRGSIGTGRLLMWRGGSLWLGRETGQAVEHAHHAIQLSLAPLGSVRLRRSDDDPWLEAPAAIVMPDEPHLFDGLGSDVAMLFVEPETTAGRALLARFGDRPLSAIDDPGLSGMAEDLLQAFAAKATDETIVAAAHGIIGHLAGGPACAAAVDPRIGKALDWMQERLDAPITLPQAAAIAHLSPSRFRHLFVAQTGISFRAYLLWSRVRRALLEGMAGGSWTEAAQQAGFADSAHLSRTCRRMFGIAPTALGRD